MSAVSDIIRCGIGATPIEARYPLTDVGQALSHNTHEGRQGKILLTC